MYKEEKKFMKKGLGLAVGMTAVGIGTSVGTQISSGYGATAVGNIGAALPTVGKVAGAGLVLGGLGMLSKSAQIPKKKNNLF